MQWNWLRETRRGRRRSPDGKYTVDFAKIARRACSALATELLTIEATGDYARANALLDEVRQGDAGDGRR